MISNFRIWIIFVLCFLSLCQYIYNKHLVNEIDKAYLQVKQLSEKLTIQNDAIDQLMIAQQLKEKLIKKSQEDAQKLRNEYDMDAKKILAQNISKNCDQAVQWGASQGRAVYECWVGKC